MDGLPTIVDVFWQRLPQINIDDFIDNMTRSIGPVKLLDVDAQYTE